MAIKDLTIVKTHLFLCSGGTCKSRGAEESTIAIRMAIHTHGLADTVHTTKTLCNGRCNDGPVVISMPEGIWFKEMTADKAEDFVTGYLEQGVVPGQERLFKYGEAVLQTSEPVVNQ